MEIWNIIQNQKSTMCIILLLVLFIVLIIAVSRKDSFFSLNNVIKQYLTIFQYEVDLKNKKHKYYKAPIVINFLIPYMFALFLGSLDYINSQVINSISSIVSIWVAILLSLVGVIHQLAKDKLGESYYTTIVKSYEALMFECCLSIFTVVMSFIYIFILPEEQNILSYFTEAVLHFFSILIYLSLFILLITMFLIFKKFNSLLGEVIKANKNQKRETDLKDISNRLDTIINGISSSNDNNENNM